MRGEISSGKHAKRHPLDWYVDEIWCARQLRAALSDFQYERERGLRIWDPACGMGNTLQAAWEAGLATVGSDLVESFAWENFEDQHGELIAPEVYSVDFLGFGDTANAGLIPSSRLASHHKKVLELAKTSTIVCNPPYSYIPGIAEAFARQALVLAAGRVCLLVPNKWLASQRRFRLFMVDHPPAAILHLTQRASMPPGDLIGAMGNRAFRGGMVDYCWVVWEAFRPTNPGDTRTVWLPPLGAPIAPVEPLA